ncbi:tRNA (guanosine(46)-N7)-methyltransferase TrmB [Paraferrimonas sedimenticola]|uniref:tRNA (guanine-N(7)-)-methyltransferase n=1 Tax=Paraferrimonas sedimenticola TaxID=375674 RepID=A0AA37RZD8_9GAMM|nr:tRNA (guanosine(46)-N7)-methyltransferase TrmB [Paraferrimonas sedimenticola]GLP98105.1 tRNA (guanine-N(7)-)-methyltransferase [Paraferrimonas sedimenticola]
MSEVTTAEFNEDGKYIRKVRSFVLREGRLTKGQQAAFDKHWGQYGIDYTPEALDLAALFGNDNPVVLEIGFGMGKSLVEMAAAQPDKNFIGIEVHKPGVGACIMEAAEQGLTNLKLFHHDGIEVLDNAIAKGSLDCVQLFFPDPWHKKRHHKRRIVQAEFAERIRGVLKVGGVLHMATDWENYAEHMTEVMVAAPGYKNQAENGDYVPRPEHRPLTKFEKRGQNLGHGVWDLMYQKVD